MELETFLKARHINLTTFRKDGRPVATPVWFVGLEGRLVVRTGANTGKVKRIRVNGKALVAPSDFRGRPVGPFVSMRARILKDPGLVAKAEEALRARYGLQDRLVRLLNRLGGSPVGQPVYIELVPMPEEGAPEGGRGS